jgi:predicted Zn-dependent peptidase
VNVGPENISVSLSGLSENMSQALALLEDLLQHAKVDQEAYDNMVNLVMKGRDDAKKNQGGYFGYLYYYATAGERNRYRDVMSEQQLKNTNPQVLIDLLKDLSGLKHRVAYYGPMAENEITGVVDNVHNTAKQLADIPENKPYLDQIANKNEVWIAPYDAKNIYMRMYHNEGRSWNPDEAAVQEVFNEYFGGGMNGVVFQEMREARGLAYNAYAYYFQPEWKDRKESVVTHIITQNDKMTDCITHFNEILNEMPASETAFQIAKDAVTKRLVSGRTTKTGIFFAYLNAQKLGLDISTNELIYKNLAKVTLQDIVNFEKANMANKPYRYIILGDEKELDMKALEKIGPIRRLTIEEVFGY